MKCHYKNSEVRFLPLGSSSQKPGLGLYFTALAANVFEEKSSSRTDRTGLLSYGLCLLKDFSVPRLQVSQQLSLLLEVDFAVYE